MMNQGIGSILDTINQALLQHVTQQQVAPVMQQISQLLAPFGQEQTMGGSGYGPGMQGSSPLDMSSAVQDAIQNRQSPYSPQSNNMTSSRDSFGMPVINRPIPENTAVAGSAPNPLKLNAYVPSRQFLGLGSFMGNV